MCITLSMKALSLLTSMDSISLGISHGDGTLHIGFDQHDNDLNYRVSEAGVATNPTQVKWTSDIFGSILVRACFCPSQYFQRS